MTAIYKKNHKFEGPDGMGYTLTRDVSSGDRLSASALKPYGGAPAAIAGEIIPRWLSKLLGAKS